MWFKNEFGDYLVTWWVWPIMDVVNFPITSVVVIVYRLSMVVIVRKIPEPLSSSTAPENPRLLWLCPKILLYLCYVMDMNQELRLKLRGEIGENLQTDRVLSSFYQTQSSFCSVTSPKGKINNTSSKAESGVVTT